jgi:hypothetical protein
MSSKSITAREELRKNLKESSRTIIRIARFVLKTNMEDMYGWAGDIIYEERQWLKKDYDRKKKP